MRPRFLLIIQVYILKVKVNILEMMKSQDFVWSISSFMKEVQSNLIYIFTIIRQCIACMSPVSRSKVNVTLKRSEENACRSKTS